MQILWIRHPREPPAVVCAEASSIHARASLFQCLEPPSRCTMYNASVRWAVWLPPPLFNVALALCFCLRSTHTLWSLPQPHHSQTTAAFCVMIMMYVYISYKNIAATSTATPTNQQHI
eukprot:scaffold96696_cov36-Tisochrysis_lutea.AAC.1